MVLYQDKMKLLCASIVLTGLFWNVKTSEPFWVKPGPTQKTSKSEEDVVFSMTRSNNENEPRLEKMTCSFQCSENDNQINPKRTLWTKPYSKKTGFTIRFSDMDFREHIMYTGDKELIALEFMIMNHGPKKVGRYHVELQYENNFNLTHEIHVKLHDVTSTPTKPSTTVRSVTKVPEGKEPLPRWIVILISVLSSTVIIVIVALILLFYYVRKKTVGTP